MPATPPGSPHRVVIVGGGAGGLPLAAELGDRHRRSGRVAVTLVDQWSTHVWKPLLHEVAAGRKDAAAHDLDYLALAHWHHFRFQQGAFGRLDRARHEVTIERVIDEDGEEILPVRVLPYDTLVLCTGSVSNDFGVAGVATNAISLDTARDAERFHRKLIAACVRADAQRAAGNDAAKVRLVIIGAGATGVELAAELRQTTEAHAAYGLDHLAPRDIRITIVDVATRVLPVLPESLASAALELLGRLDIDVKTGQRVIGVEPAGVRIATGELLPADLVVWAAGIKAPDLTSRLDGLEEGRGHQVVVSETLATTRDPDVFAFGDCADCPWPQPGDPGARVPPRAQAARQQGQLLVKTVDARLEGRPLPAFRFHDYGSLVSLGELSAIGNLMGSLIGGNMMIQGLIARVMYVSLYKRHQVSLLGVVRVTLDTIGRFLRGHASPRVKLH